MITYDLFRDMRAAFYIDRVPVQCIGMYSACCFSTGDAAVDFVFYHGTSTCCIIFIGSHPTCNMTFYFKRSGICKLFVYFYDDPRQGDIT